MKLSEWKIGYEGVITGVNAGERKVKLFADYGLVKGAKIKLIALSPFNGPAIYSVGGAEIALRLIDAAKVDAEVYSL